MLMYVLIDPNSAYALIMVQSSYRSTVYPTGQMYRSLWNPGLSWITVPSSITFKDAICTGKITFPSSSRATSTGFLLDPVVRLGLGDGDTPAIKDSTSDKVITR